MIVIKRVDEVQVFVTEGGDVAIVQTDGHGEESAVFVPLEHAEVLWLAIRDAIEAGADAKEQERPQQREGR